MFEIPLDSFIHVAGIVLNGLGEILFLMFMCLVVILIMIDKIIGYLLVHTLKITVYVFKIIMNLTSKAFVKVTRYIKNSPKVPSDTEKYKKAKSLSI